MHECVILRFYGFDRIFNNLDFPLPSAVRSAAAGGTVSSQLLAAGPHPPPTSKH